MLTIDRWKTKFGGQLTPEVVAQMVKTGWTEEKVLELKAEGYRYSPGRDSLLGPVMSSDDEEFD